MSKNWRSTLFKWLVKGAAMVLICLSVYLAFTDRVAAGTLLASLSIVVGMSEYVPEMESVKALGFEAKMRARLSEADSILTKLRQTTLALGQLTYLNLAYDAKVGGIPTGDKQKAADLIDDALKDIGIGPQSIMELKIPYLRFARFDAFRKFDGVVQLAISKHLRPLFNKMDERGQDETDPQWQAASAVRNKLEEKRRRMGFLDETGFGSFRELCHYRIPAEGMTMNDTQALKHYADNISDIVDEAMKAGRITEKLAALIEASKESLYTEVIGECPPPP